MSQAMNKDTSELAHCKNKGTVNSKWVPSLLEQEGTSEYPPCIHKLSIKTHRTI